MSNLDQPLQRLRQVAQKRSYRERESLNKESESPKKGVEKCVQTDEEPLEKRSKMHQDTDNPILEQARRILTRVMACPTPKDANGVIQDESDFQLAQFVSKTIEFGLLKFRQQKEEEDLEKKVTASLLDQTRKAPKPEPRTPPQESWSNASDFVGTSQGQQFEDRQQSRDSWTDRRSSSRGSRERSREKSQESRFSSRSKFDSDLAWRELEERTSQWGSQTVEDYDRRQRELQRREEEERKEMLERRSRELAEKRYHVPNQPEQYRPVAATIRNTWESAIRNSECCNLCYCRNLIP